MVFLYTCGAAVTTFHPVNLPLPWEDQLETRPVLKKLTFAHRHLAELKGVVRSIPNETILLSTLALQEAKDSSEVENIVTTHDDLFRDDAAVVAYNPAAKEVKNYVEALGCGFRKVKEA